MKSLMMSHKQVLQLVIALFLAISFLVGCGGSASTTESEVPAATSTPEQAMPEPTKVVPRVFFTAPANGATVTSPVHVTMQAENFTIEPEGEAKPGRGHFHIVVDAECIRPNQDIPKHVDEETYLHFTKGELEADLDLAPGTHTLCLQAGTGQHVAIFGEGMTHEISVTVE